MTFVISVVGDVILLGTTNVFRFNHPREAAELREKRKVSTVQMYYCFLGLYYSHKNISLSSILKMVHESLDITKDGYHGLCCFYDILVCLSQLVMC